MRGVARVGRGTASRMVSRRPHDSGRLTAVRHAAPAIPGICYGRTAVAVALDAAVAARRVVESLAGDAPDVIWSSPSERCLEPARRLGAYYQVPLCVDEGVLELDFGRWEGRSWAAIEAEEPRELAAWMQAWQGVAPPGGESVRELERRVREWWQGLESRTHHLLMAHAGVIRALHVIAGGEDWTSAMRREIAPLQARTFPVPISAA